MQKIKLNNKGIGRKETMAILLLIIVLFIVVLNTFLKKLDNTKFDNFRKLASNFIEDVSRMRNLEAAYENGAYLYDVINMNYGKNIVSPFNSKDNCDVYESRIQVINNTPHITLKCSDYIIYDEETTAKKFKIYKVSDWTDKEITSENVQTADFYNYEINGVEQLDKYYNEKEFMIKYTEKTGKKIYSVSALDNGQNILTKKFYRTMDEVK